LAKIKYMPIRKEGRIMALVKAKMSFYHDQVGTRAKDEMFDVQNENLISQLEQAGYVQRVEGQALQAYEQTKTLEQQVGQRNALTNEAVSLATHDQNQKAAQHQQEVAQIRKQAGQAAVEQEITRLEQAGETHRAEQLRQGLESQRQQMAQQQQQDQRGLFNSQQQMSEQQRQMVETAEAANMNQAQTVGNTEIAEAEQAAANTANTAKANAKRANK
jgi:hypothetical protein